MAIALILAFDDRKRLLSKPAEYSDLIHFARKFFDKLEEFKDDEVTFQFTPEWGGAELELDESAFEFVHHRAELRVVTSKQNSSTKAKRLADYDEPRDESRPQNQKKIKTEASTPQPVEIIDLTQSEHVGSCLSVSGQIVPVARDQCADEGLKLSSQHNQHISQQLPHQTQAAPENLISAQSLLDAEHSLVNQSVDAALVSSQGSEPSQTGSTAGLQSQSQTSPQTQSATGNQSSTTSGPQVSSETEVAQLVSTTALTAHNYSVVVASPARDICPHRQQIAAQWVRCRRPKTESDGDGQHTVRLLTEHHIMCLTFKSKHAHVTTLVQHALSRGYPIARIEIRKSDGSDPRFGSQNVIFGRSGIESGSDIYMFHNERPGVYLLPSRHSRSVTSHVRIKLNLVPELNIISLYPWTKIETKGHSETVDWQVSMNGDNIVSKANQEMYYGHPSLEIAAYFATICTLQPDNLSPCTSLSALILNPKSWVVLSRTDMFNSVGSSGSLTYLGKVLRTQLHLPLGMARDFENYFRRVTCRRRRLSVVNEAHFEKNHIAISFVPRKIVDKIAPLNIEPKPAAVKRVWMLYSLVNTSQWMENARWSVWRGRQLTPSDALQKENWAEIIGLDTGLQHIWTFRAIEWNVMEVPMEYLVHQKKKNKD